MIIIISAIVFATILTQIPNILGINNAKELTLGYCLKISLYTLPLTFFATALYTFFYGKGSLFLSYPSLSVLAKVFSLIVAIIIQVWFLKNKSTNIFEIIGIIISITGTFIIIYNKEINQFFNN